MAHLIETLQELKQLPPEIHLLCPRQSADDGDRYELEPSQDGISGGQALDSEKISRIEDAKSRRKKFVSCLQLLAFDGEESVEHQRYIWESLDVALGQCELCIREYYVGKLGLLAELQEEYEDDEIQRFFDIIDQRDIRRITGGLARAASVLRDLPEQKRTLSTLDSASLYSIFEALSCEALLKDDAQLQKHFDEPFKLIQSKRQLKTRDYVPAATRFLFDTNQSRLAWATFTWSRFERPPTDMEWNWTIKSTLQRQLHEATTPNAILRLWSGLLPVVKRLDQKQIVYNLCDLVPNICTTALNHLSRKSYGLRFILQTMKLILEKAPGAFWHAMGSISSSTVIEQVFESPNFEKLLQDGPPRSSPLEQGETDDGVPDMLSWIPPLLKSLQPANRPPACRTLTTQLFKRMHNANLSDEARYYCYQAAMNTLLQTLRSFTDNVDTRQSVGRLVLSDTLETVSQHIDDVLKPVPIATSEKQQQDAEALASDVTKNSLALECQCLKADFETLSNNQTLQHGLSTYSPDIWAAVVRNLSNDNVQLSSAALMGLLHLPGLEKFHTRREIELSKEQHRFNTVFEKMTGLVSQIFERISEFKPQHLDELFKGQETSMPLISALFSADLTTYQAAVDLVKNISGHSGRKEALAHLLLAFLGTTVYALCWSFRRIANMKTYSSVPRMMKTGMEVLDVLCNTQTGLIRTRELDHRDAHAVQNYWAYQWQALKMVFRNTEKWNSQGREKVLLTEACRDAMQYAEALFEQYDVFANALVTARPERAAMVPKTLLQSDNGSPGATLDAMTKWLRLRDDYLAMTLVKLFAKILRRLGDQEMVVSTECLAYVEDVATTSEVRTILSSSEKAELLSALEAYYKKPLKVGVPKKQGTLKDWVDTSRAANADEETPGSREQSIDDFADSEIGDEDFYALSNKSIEINKARLAARDKDDAKEQAKKKAEILRPVSSKIVKQISKKLDTVKPVNKQEEVSAFLLNRRKETEARKARDREAAALLRGKAGVANQTKGQGSGLSGIGVKGKDHSAPQDRLMVSSESESESDDELDRQLFGSKVKTVKSTAPGLFAGMIQPGSKQPLQGPIKKVKQARSQKDMRARLAPDLSSLHKVILSWDFFIESELPPTSAKNDYTLVTNTFRTPLEYQKTFEPLLLLEGWQSFRSAKEEGSFKPFELKVSNRLSVDSFVEVSATMSMAGGKELGLGVADVVLLSKANKPETDPSQAHCLARVKQIGRKKGQVEVVYRVNPFNNSLVSTLAPGMTLWGVQILSLTPLEREYGALLALPHYDLCEEIIKAKPSPLLNYSDDEVKSILETYDVNVAQAKAVKSALDNDAFTLIQGPPGSGKTKTICALVGAMMTNSLIIQDTSISLSNAKTRGGGPSPGLKKVLVCAPSNAAVDELVMRFKNGVKTMDGTLQRLSVVRLGRSDAINVNVKDLTLEELVNAKLELAAPKNANDKPINDIMMEHKDASEQLIALRTKIDDTRAQGQPLRPEDESQFDGLKRKKAQLSLQIDQARDRQSTASRDAELNRKRMQQEILDSAHVLCATLSGSGHDLFQGLNIEFETVIIDEAAQSIELSALIPLKYGCSKCILVGDPKQLPPTVLSREAARFQYEQSLFARMEKNHQKDIHLLDTQYRMHPEISIFPSKSFYDSRLRDGPGMAKLRARPWHHSSILAPYRFFDVQGMQSSGGKGHSLINIAEISVAMQLYERVTTDVRKYDFKGKVGIITPYKGQLRELKARFSQRYGQGILSAIDFNTTDAFQGRESEVIIFSCVRASTTGIGFLNDIRRMNVGLTRAKCSLWVLGNSQSLIQGEFWRKLVVDAKARNLYSGGSILELLNRPLLTEAMMRDDVEMEDGSPAPGPVSSARRPSLAMSEAISTTVNNPSRSPIAVQSNSKSIPSPHINSFPPVPPIQPMSETMPNVRRVRSEVVPTEVRSQTDIKPETRRQLSDEKVKDGVYGPSGGRYGLNDHAVCQICGSSAHFSHNCNNMAAHTASLGLCERCKGSSHTMRECRASRCLECGTVGHLSESCDIPIHLRLSEDEKERVKRQEASHIRERQRGIEKRVAKQMGEHASEVPIVKHIKSSNGKVNGAPVAPRGEAAVGPPTWKTGGHADPKRKREKDASPTEVPKAPKSIKGSGRSEDPMEGSHLNDMQNRGVSQGVDASHALGKGHIASSGPTRGGGTGRSGIGGVTVKKKKQKDDDMFMRRR